MTEKTPNPNHGFTDTPGVGKPVDKSQVGAGPKGGKGGDAAAPVNNKG
jgi:hypothetical protein